MSTLRCGIRQIFAFCLSERLFSGKMEKSGIPQKQILEEIMKHTHHIIRLLTLAVVSCALAALLRQQKKVDMSIL